MGSRLHGRWIVVSLLAACGGQPQETATETAAPGSTSNAGTTTAAAAPTTGAQPGDAETTESASTGAAGSTTDAPTASTGTTTGSTTDASTSGVLRPDLPPPCEPLTCMEIEKNCGDIPDGCGGELACGECEEPDSCGGGGVDNVCGHPCVPIRVLFFDLGDTLVEADGDLFVERPGVNAMISELKGLGMRVGIITNVPDDYTLQTLKELLVNPEFVDEFELVLLSSEAVAPPKPDAAIFSEAYSLLIDAPPIAEVAYVSENLAEIADGEPPTQGARAAGMLGIHLSSAPPSPLADYTLAPDLPELLVEMAEMEWIDCEGSP